MTNEELPIRAKRNELCNLARVISAATDNVNVRRRGVEIAEEALADARAALQDAMNTFDLRLTQYLPDTTEGEK